MKVSQRLRCEWL